MTHFISGCISRLRNTWMLQTTVNHVNCDCCRETEAFVTLNSSIRTTFSLLCERHGTVFDVCVPVCSSKVSLTPLEHALLQSNTKNLYFYASNSIEVFSQKNESVGELALNIFNLTSGNINSCSACTLSFFDTDILLSSLALDSFLMTEGARLVTKCAFTIERLLLKRSSNFRFTMS